MAKKKKRLGRPPKPTSEKRSAVLYLKLTPAERRLIDSAAGDQPTVWARRVLLRAAKGQMFQPITK